jgi:hypothetical protein
MLQVFVYEIEDIDASTWLAAVPAANEGDARRRLRDRGLHRKQVRHQGRPVRQESLAAFGVLGNAEAQLLRRRLDDAGWTDWELVPETKSLDWRVSGRNRRA